MNLYERITAEFSKMILAGEWDETLTLFCRVASDKAGHWLLPLRACETVGGTMEQAIPAILAVACGHIGIVLVDDLLDNDPRGEYLKIGEPAAANMASALQSVAMSAISHSGLSHDAKITALESMNEMFLATSIGQYWDVNSVIADEDAYWKIAKAKSSPFFGAALQLGALMGGASVEFSNKFRELGNLYGEMIQIHDDVGDTLAVPAKMDWSPNRAPLPILFAKLVDHPSRNRFNELLPHAANDPQALEEAQDILIKSGAISYCFYQLLNRSETAGSILPEMSIERADVLVKVFDDLIRPVHQLFEAADGITAQGNSARMA